MGVKQATYARMESGKALPRVTTVKNIAQAFGIQYSQLEAVNPAEAVRNEIEAGA
jgi:transcriptional regulator with XRE-family HTH domain